MGIDLFFLRDTWNLFNLHNEKSRGRKILKVGSKGHISKILADIFKI